MSAKALMGDSFYEEMMQDLDCLPANVQRWIKWMQETFNEIMHTMSNALRHVPDSLKTKEMCIRAVEENPWQLKDVATPYALRYVPDRFITQEICEDPRVFFLILTVLKQKKCVKRLLR